MGVQAPSAQSTMTTKEMLKTFSPIILFSIILPLIDIVTDLRIIIRLYSGVVYCLLPENDIIFGFDLDYVDLEYEYAEYANAPYPVCELETHTKFATLLLGKVNKLNKPSFDIWW